MTPPLPPYEEGEFSLKAAALAGDGDCWICLFPLGTRHDHKELEKSRDHVTPRVHGGGNTLGNIRMAHKWCNSHRRERPLTADVMAECRTYILKRHGNWLVHTRQYTGAMTVEEPRCEC